MDRILREPDPCFAKCGPTSRAEVAARPVTAACCTPKALAGPATRGFCYSIPAASRPLRPSMQPLGYFTRNDPTLWAGESLSENHRAIPGGQQILRPASWDLLIDRLFVFSLHHHDEEDSALIPPAEPTTSQLSIRSPSDTGLRRRRNFV